MNLKNPYNSYRWQFQPYVSWKGKSTTSIIPIKSRPNTNQTSRAAHSAPNNSIYVDESNDYSSAFGTARPLKHYRKQLKPPRKDSAKSIGRDQSMIDLPGSAVYLGIKSNVEGCSKCRDNDNSILGSIKENILRENNNIKEHIHEGDKFLNNCNQRPVCQSCNPENNRIRSAVTLLNKRYYSDTKNYLKSRVKTYEQNLNLSKNKFIQYQDDKGNPLLPQDNFYSWQGLLNNKYELDGKAIAPQQFVSTNFIQKGCNDECGGYTKRTIIYKPSNQNFAREGAVSSGLRTLNAKVNNINKNANSFYTAWGREGANAGKYSSNVNAPIFLKTRYQVCIPNIRRRVIWNNNTGRQPKGGSGNNTLCFHTPQGSIIPSTNGDTISNISGTGTGRLIPKQQIFR
jgi:hypothetical protein